MGPSVVRPFSIKPGAPNWKVLLNRCLFALLGLSIIGTVYGMCQAFNVPDLLNNMELQTYDLRATTRFGDADEKPSPNIVLIGYDEPSLRYYHDKYGAWPWPRSVHSNMVDFLNAFGAKMISFDLIFVSPQAGREKDDQALVDAFRKYRNVYLSMNFESDMEVDREKGYAMPPEDVEKIRPLSIDLDSRLDRNNMVLQLDSTGFYRNQAMTFNNFNKILPGLLETGERVAFINHGPDADGVSRGNPLFYRFLYYAPMKSPYIPYGRSQRTGQYFDSENHPVTKDGYLIKPDGQLVIATYQMFEPYLAFRMFTDLKYPGEKIHYEITPNGHLKFKDMDIPLTRNGSYLGHWFNFNVYRDDQERQIRNLEAHHTPEGDAEAARMKEDLKNKPFEAQPYRTIPAWKVLDAMADWKAGTMTTADKELAAYLKDKIIFIGNLSTAGYDIKPTPIGRLMPGVVIQATVFDNLYQNRGYIVRLDPIQQALVTLLLCVLAAGLAYKSKTAALEFTVAGVLGLLYIIVSTIVFKKFNLWLEIVYPVSIMGVATMLVLLYKYILRNKDYERTQAQANTDSMTGLYNHHFFKKHMSTSIERARQFNISFSLILLDIDFFKRFNDTYGHQAGDEVLRCVANKLKANVRMMDVVARYGGEEMAIILDGSTYEEALHLAQKVVKAVAEEAYPIAEGITKHVTISAGVATFPQHGRTISELVEHADKGLYNAKRNGRNQVGIPEEGPLPLPEPGESDEADSA